MKHLSTLISIKGESFHGGFLNLQFQGGSSLALVFHASSSLAVAGDPLPHDPLGKVSLVLSFYLPLSVATLQLSFDKQS